MISVITPSYGQPDWLQLCARSVADQAGVIVEHIVKDAGTLGVSARDSRVAPESANYHFALQVEKDDGMYDAVNRGLRRARGEICAYLNCDEQYLPGTLRNVEEFFAAHPSTDVLFGDAILVDADGFPISYRRAILPSLAHLRVADLNTLTCATFFSRRLVEAGHFFPTHLKIAGDQFWIFHLMKAGAKMAVLPKPLSVFTFTGDNLSQSAQAAFEKFGWLPQDENPRRALTPLVVAAHRFKKLLAGAYRRRDIDIEIYTRQSPEHRTSISARHVGFQWPQTGTAAHP